MKSTFYNLVAAFLFSPLLLLAQESIVFESGTDGYASFRIPAIIKNPKGHLIAFAEGRVDHAGDFGNVDIVYKISKNKGQTWGPLQVLVDYAQLQAGNPAPIVDLLDPHYPKGRLFLFYNTGNNHEGEVRNGKGWREVWYVTSIDGGKTWSEAINITTQVHRPFQPAYNPEFTFKEDWRTYANTPGHGFQMVNGPNKGRLYVAANHNAGKPKSNNTDWNAHAYYSDDHGKTFHLSDPIPFPGSNETSAAQIGANEVYMSSRNQTYQPRQRIISRSTDGGTTWISSLADPQLPDPINQGSVLSWRVGKTFILAHCNAADSTHRDLLTLRLSKDGGETWYWNQLIAQAPKDYKSGSYAAYSDIVLVQKRKMGVLFEKNNYQQIVFQCIQLPK